MKEWMVRHRHLTQAGLVLGINILLVLFALIPIFNQVKTVTKKISVKNNEVKELSDKSMLLAKIDLNVMRERVDLIKNALPAKKDVYLYLATLNALSSDLGLSFGGIVISPGEVTDPKIASSTASTKTKPKTKTKNRLEVLDTEVKILGNKEGIYTFLRQVEQTLPLMQITDIKVTYGGDYIYTLTLSLGMLWAPETEANTKGKITLFTDEDQKYFDELMQYRKFDYAMQGLTENIVPEAGAPERDLFSNQTSTVIESGSVTSGSDSLE